MGTLFDYINGFLYSDRHHSEEYAGRPGNLIGLPTIFHHF